MVNGNDKGLHTLFKEGWIKFEVNKVSLAKFTFIATETDASKVITSLQQNTNGDVVELEVLIKYHQEDRVLYRGVVKSFHKEITPSQTVVKIECKDIANELTKSSVEVFSGDSFEDIISTYVHNFSIKLENIDIVQGKDEVISQHPNTVPWDYIISYLDNLGYLVGVENGKMRIIDIDDVSDVKYNAEYGVNIFSFSVKTESQRRKSKVSISSWNIEEQEVVSVDVSQDTPDNEEVLRLNINSIHLTTLERMAKAKLKRSNVASIYGNVLTFGNLEAIMGDYIQLNKVEDEVDSKSLLITSVVHKIENGNWKTEFSFGLEQEAAFLENIYGSQQNTQSRLGLTNSVYGLQIGVVEQIEGDPEGQFRIKVKLPALFPELDGFWSRLTQIYASNSYGAIFIPDIGDEVVVAFMDNNLDSPIVLGSMYSSSKSAPNEFKDDNNIKGIVTRSGTKIMLDEEDKSIILSNKSGDSIVVSDNLKGIKIQDQNGNVVQMSDSGINLTSQTSLKIEANSGVEIIGNSGIKIETSAILELKGSIIKLN